MVWLKARLAVFVDGCYWHGCPEHYSAPKGRTAVFWKRKLETNTTRDQKVTQLLQEQGWTVLRIWEHSVMADADGQAQNIKHLLNERTTR